MTQLATHPATPDWNPMLVRLARQDPRLRPLIRRAGPCTLAPRGDYFAALCEAVLAQQISNKAAMTVQARFRALFTRQQPDPAELLGFDAERLRGCGIGPMRQGYLRSLAQAVLDGGLPGSWEGYSDEQVIARLTRIRGIGRWTAEMFLIFVLCRVDVFPVDDLGVQVAAARLIGRPGRLRGEPLRRLGRLWAPYRTLATWYLWWWKDGAEFPVELPRETEAKAEAEARAETNGRTSSNGKRASNGRASTNGRESTGERNPTKRPLRNNGVDPSDLPGPGNGRVSSIPEAAPTGGAASNGRSALKRRAKPKG